MEMEKSENTANQSLSASLCTSGCGFFGSQKFDGMCSQCYKDALKRQQTPDSSCSRSATPPSSSSTTTASSNSPTAQSVETGTTTIKPINTMSSNPAAAIVDANTAVSDTVDSIKTLIVESSTCSDRAAVSCSTSASSDEGAIGAEATTSKQETGTAVSESPASPSPSEPEKKNKRRNKCGTCKKKVGLTGFECRCGGLFCGLHRYSDKHDCQYDYKKEGEETIRKNNPLVVGAKVQKI